MNYIVEHQTYSEKKYHIVFQDEIGFWYYKCNTWWKSVTIHSNAKIVASGDTQIILSDKQLCGKCFGNHIILKFRVSANEGRISQQSDR